MINQKKGINKSEKSFDALILAAGKGKRFRDSGGSVLKQVAEYESVPVIKRLYDQLSANKKIKEIIVVLSNDRSDQEVIKAAIGSNKVNYLINHDCENDNNLISFLVAAQNVENNLIVLECDCVSEETDIDKMLSSTLQNDITFSNLGSIDNYKYGGVIELSDSKKPKKIHVFSEEEMILFKKDFQGAKLFGATCFGKEALTKYKKMSQELTDKKNKYFLEVAIAYPNSFVFKTVKMSRNSFHFNTLNEFNKKS